MQPNLIVAIVGPTAAGKSDLAIDVAERIGAEIVNADSMQLYRGMDIGTAKVSEAERKGVRHHLLDVLNVTETSTVAEFQELARGAIADCLARGVTPIVVGGSALYVRAVVDRFEFPGTEPDVRARLEKELADVGATEMHNRLTAVDPMAAAAILPTNSRRIVRALEVIEITGKPFTATLPSREYFYDHVVQIGLDVPRPVLDERIALRVDRMWKAGLVNEVKALEANRLREGKTAPRALGYAQVLAYLAGEYSESEAKQRTISATRRFARRQDSWFRRDERIQWVPFDASDLADRVLHYDRRP